MPAGVDVDGDQRLGFINDDVAAAFQVDLAREGVLQLARDVQTVENRLVLRVKGDLPRRPREMREIMARMRS